MIERVDGNDELPSADDVTIRQTKYILPYISKKAGPLTSENGYLLSHATPKFWLLRN